MGLWKITDKGPIKVSETKFKQEKLLEEHLENWISSDSSILGEPVLIIGRQVQIPDMRECPDLLGLDPQGNTVIIELKRGKLKDPVDMQAMRYASYISKWTFTDFENAARNYFGKTGDHEFNFNAMYESFCEDAGVDEIPDINKDQRIIIVGSAVRDKLGSVALWLYEHSVDIKVIEVKAYKDNNGIFIEPNTVVPLKVNKFSEAGRVKVERMPWLTNGKSWHLEKRCSTRTKEILLRLDKIIQDNFDVDGPRWNPKLFVAYRVNNYNWLVIFTRPKLLELDFLVKAKSFNSDEISRKLHVVKFDREVSLSEKLALPSSIYIKNRNEQTDRISLRIKEDFDIESDEFLVFLKDTYKAFPK